MPEPKYEIWPFTEGHLFSALANPHATAAQVGNFRQPTYLAGYLTKIKAKWIVVECEYVDGDYLEDFTSYYATCFDEYPRFCRRLHFFGGTFTEQSIADILDGANQRNVDRFCRAYLGFVVARPLPQAVIGRTILQSYPHRDRKRERFYQARRRYQLSLFGISLEIESLAFQQQDTVVSACATVSLWSAFHKTAELFGTAAPRPARITASANTVRTPSRAMPSHSLRADQMCEAVRSVGLEPEIHKLGPTTPLASFIYAYLALGVPVILGVEVDGDPDQGHALTVTGYTIPKVAPLFEESQYRSVTSYARRIDEIYVHDDNVGPFARLAIRPPDQFGSRAPFVLRGVSPTGQDEALFVPVFALAPVYPKIRLKFFEIHAWAQRITALLVSLGFRLDMLEWEIRLTTTSIYKDYVRQSLTHLQKARELLSTPQPRFIWLARLRHRETLLVDVLGDATGIQRSCPLFQALWYDEPTLLSLQETYRDPPLRDGIELVLSTKFTANILQLPDRDSNES